MRPSITPAAAIIRPAITLGVLAATCIVAPARAGDGPKGACCFPSGACGVFTTADCAANGGSFQGAGTVCSVGLCQQPAGACCFDDGSCTQATQAACNAAGGGADWQGAGTQCLPGLCIPLVIKGACCFDGGACAAVTEAQCAAEGGTYEGDDTVCTPGGCVGASEADINHDFLVNVNDLLIVLVEFGCAKPDDCQGDVSGDGVCNLDDLMGIVLNWGPVE